MAVRVRRAVVALLATAVSLYVWAAPAMAQAPPGSDAGPGVPNPDPDAGIPGFGLIEEVLGWLKFGALAAAVAGLLVGGIATAAGHTGSHYGAATSGRNWLLGGLAAAVIAGLAHTVAIALFEATQ